MDLFAKKTQLSNGKDFNIWNDAYNLTSYFNYFNFTSSCVKMLVKGLCGRRMEIAVACKKWVYLFLICSTSDGKNLSVFKLRMSSSFMPRVVTWPEQQVSSYTVWTLGNILLLTGSNTNRGIWAIQPQVCWMWNEASCYWQPWDIQDTRKHSGILENGYMWACFLPCFFLQFFFTSFSARDRSYLSIFRLWQNVLLDKVSLSASVPVVKQPNKLFLI